jgi:hypothetical protein
MQCGSESGGIPLYNNDEDQTVGGMAEDEIEEADLIECVDEDGNSISLEVIRYFFYNGDEYVILGEAQPTDACHDHCSCCEHDECDDDATMELYIMKVEPSKEDDDMEEFVPVEDEDLLEQLIRVAEATFDEDNPDGEDE